ncbi:MAG: GNAT family N-acetyltransferase [Anaerolineales bacterium]|jgi:GNAT superfamily N-acetyltransferase
MELRRHDEFMLNETNLDFVDADKELKDKVREQWGEKVAHHMHLDDGFSILAMQEEKFIGLISVYWKILPAPLPETYEGYIDILEVHQDFHRKGIATQLIDKCLKRAQERSVYQLRAWSSLDKREATSMWKALGFGLCPATTYPGGQEVQGYFAVKLLDND